MINPSQPVPTALQPYTGPTYLSRSFDTSMQRSMIYVFFHMFWNIQFLIYFTYLVIAGVIAQWYFTPYQADGSKVLPMMKCLAECRSSLGYRHVVQAKGSFHVPSSVVPHFAP